MHICGYVVQMVSCINGSCVCTLICVYKLVELNARFLGNQLRTLAKGCLHLYHGMFLKLILLWHVTS